MEGLRSSDIFDDGTQVALHLGVLERGEGVKTGHNQGVIVERGFVGDLLVAMKYFAGPDKYDKPRILTRESSLLKIQHSTGRVGRIKS